MPWWKKLRSLWPGAPRHQVTRTGIVYALTLLVVAMAAFVSANNLLFLILAAMLSVLLISGFVSRLTLSGLEIELLMPEHICARRKMRGSIRITNLKRGIPSFSVRVMGATDSGIETSLYFPVIPGKTTIEEPVEVYFPTRGRWRERTFQFATRFPFGFAERRELVTTRHEIIVYPCLDPRPAFEALLSGITGEIESQQRGRGHDFYRIRPYEALESSRHVDWKATAHTGSLQVREFTREEDHQVLIYLDLDVAPGENAWFETAVECSAFLVYQLSERGIHLRFRTQEADVELPEHADVYTILRYLALVTPLPGSAPAAPNESTLYEIILTAHPDRIAILGSGTRKARRTRVLGPDSFDIH